MLLDIKNESMSSSGTGIRAFCKKKVYAKIGYEKAKEELNIWFNEQIKKYK